MDGWLRPGKVAPPPSFPFLTHFQPSIGAVVPLLQIVSPFEEEKKRRSRFRNTKVVSLIPRRKGGAPDGAK